MVIKASGLAAGKGVLIPNNTAEALQALDKVMKQRAFGDAGVCMCCFCVRFVVIDVQHRLFEAMLMIIIIILIIMYVNIFCFFVCDQTQY